MDNKHSLEFDLGVKSPWGILSLPWMVWDLNIRNEMVGIRVASIYKIYPRMNKFYFGPAVDFAVSNYNGSYHACTHCADLAADINFTRVDAGFFFLLGRKATKAGTDVNFGVGFRLFYCNLSAHYGPQFGGNNIQNGDGYVIGKPFFGGQPGYVNGFYIVPGVHASIALGK